MGEVRRQPDELALGDTQADCGRDLHTSARWNGGAYGTASAGAAPIPLGDVTEHVQEVWTPETLLLAAAESSAMLAFLDEARRCHLEVRAYRSSARASVRPCPDGHLRFRSLEILPTVEVQRPADAQVAETIFRALPWRCPVEASLKAEVAIRPRILVASPTH